MAKKKTTKRKSRASSAPPRVFKRKRRAVVVTRRRKSRVSRPTTRARSLKQKRQRANRRAGQLKRHSRKAGTISRETKKKKPARGTTATVDTIPAVGRKGADPLQIQVSAKFKLPAGMVPSANLVKQAILHRIEHGFDAPGVTTSIVRWRNPARRDPAKRGWREGDQDAAFATLGNALRAWAGA